jgi:hypothetical protein
MDPHPTHLDQRDPGKPRGDIRDEVDREIAAYGGLAELVLLVPEDRWSEFLRLAGVQGDDEVGYRGATLRKAAVTAVVAQEGF